jgi:hypothetical protein
MNSFPIIEWLVPGYRPAIASNGINVVYELHESGTPARLFQIALNDSPITPRVFLPGVVGAQTRPDWCWAKNQIAFNIKDVKAPRAVFNEIYTVGGDGNNLLPVNDTRAFIYPQWDNEGTSLTVYNNRVVQGMPQPHTSVIDLNGVVRHENVNGRDSNGAAVFAGQPGVRPTDANSVVFAGQPDVPDWSEESPGYDQEANYIFINSLSGPCAPLERGAPIDQFDPAFQGRAPAWSPNGRYVVFESDREGPYGLYLFDTRAGGSAIPITNYDFDLEHAKFYPDGRRIIFSGRQSARSVFTLATLDISQYVS